MERKNRSTSAGCWSRRLRAGGIAVLALAALPGGFCNEKTTTNEAVPARVNAAVAVVREASGRALVRRAEGGGTRGRAQARQILAAGESVLTGEGARVDMQVGPEACWRLGEKAQWRAGASARDVELGAGTALAVVPREELWQVRTPAATVRLGAGAWLLTVVENGGLKVVALDAGQAEAERTEGARADTLKLRAGEVVFARPGGKGFSEIVTIYLDELLASSRLVTKFTQPLPGMERLRQQAEVQRERLSSVSNVHVAGARDEAGFQLIVPKE